MYRVSYHQGGFVQKVYGTPQSETDTNQRSRVLVVDDSIAQAHALAMMLRRWGFDVTEAHSGAAALEICQDWPPDVIVSDWVMPEMTGIDFCRAFRTMPDQSFAYFILLTAKSGSAELALGLEAGADDFTTKPVNSAELRARINAGARIVSMQKELRRTNEQVSKMLQDLQIAHNRIDADLRQARNIQQALVPTRERQFGRSRISLLLHPCGHVGGDLSGMFASNSGTIGFYNIDVSGHGITSAMMIARVAGYLNPDFPDENLALVRSDAGLYQLRPPNDLACLLNQRLLRDRGVQEYLTMAFGTLDLDRGEVSLVQAGHPPALLLRANGDCSFLGNGGMPVGLLNDATFSTLTTRLGPGDRLLLYSDGFSECVMQDGAQLGEEGLKELVRRIPKEVRGTEFLDDLYWRLMQGRQQGADPEDDISATLVEYVAD